MRSGEALFDYCLLDVWAENSGQNQATRGININCGDSKYYATVYASNCTFNIKAKGNQASSAASVYIHKNTSSQAAMYLLDGCKLTSTLDPNVNNYTPADIHLDSSSYGNVYYTSGVTFTDGTNTPVVVNSGYGGVTLGTYTYPATAE